jgi:hypothetical protein
MEAPDNAGRGPIWSDVGVLLGQLSQKWGGVWHISIRTPARASRIGELWLVCERSIATGKSGSTAQQRSARAYPTSDRLSFPAVVFGLLVELDARLEDDSGVAARQASF